MRYTILKYKTKKRFKVKDRLMVISNNNRAQVIIL